MAKAASPAPGQWAALADLPEEARQAAMRQRYEEIARLSDNERVAVFSDMTQEEYQLPEDKLLAFTQSRLLVWLALGPEAAQKVAHGYDEAVSRLPASQAMRRVSSVQTVLRNFTSAQVERLDQLIPSITREVPRRPQALTPATKPPRVHKKKRWWKFW
ncbi:MAG: hypothetical protein HY535_04445 [Chloroflexi bacterium]|nr:hypothetical protein [Chloroflexota bacterium]